MLLGTIQKTPFPNFISQFISQPSDVLSNQALSVCKNKQIKYGDLSQKKCMQDANIFLTFAIVFKILSLNYVSLTIYVKSAKVMFLSDVQGISMYICEINIP